MIIAALAAGAGVGALAAAAWLLPARTRAEARLAALSEQQQAIGELREQAKLQFESLASSIMENNSKKFTAQSQERLQELLNPLKERLSDFQKKVDDSFSEQGKQQFSLTEEIKRIVETNEKMRLQTDSLTRALKGDSKAQGNWGEVMLERILEDAGLQQGRDYTLQGVDMGLKHVEHGGVLKPDVVVNLPDGKHVIIDSKVSLTHYERYCAAPEAERPAYLKQYLQSLRQHVNGLAERRYQDADRLDTPDVVLMFVPMEGAFSLAVQQDAGLHRDAWDRKVAIVCPTTLFVTLQTVASLWKREMQNRNVQEIAQSAGGLYDKVAGFVEDMQQLGERLERTHKTYDEAMNKLKDGRGSVLSRVEHLKKLGAKTSRQLPKELLDEEETALPALAEADVA